MPHAFPHAFLGSSRRGRRHATAWTAALLLLLAASSLVVDSLEGETRAVAPASTVVATGPNIVEVMVDDARADDLQWMPFVRTLMHRRGLEFRNSFSSFPLCCPARASFFSGQFTHNHRVLYHDDQWGYEAFDDRYTLATSLQAAGYQTGLVGKYINQYGVDPSLVASREAGQPVQSYDYVPYGWDDWRASLKHSPVTGNSGTGRYFHTAYNINGVPGADHEGEYSTYTMTNFAVDTLRNFHAADRRFYVSINYLAPHWSTDDEPGDPVHVRLLDGSYEHFPTTDRPDWVKGHFDSIITHGMGMPRDGSQPEVDVSDKPVFFQNMPNFSSAEKVAETAVARQRAESLLVVDGQVRRLVNELKAQGEWDDTVLIVTSDNGYMLGEHRVRGAKVRAHEPSMRVPFLITGPGIRQGELRYDPISTVDVTRTILALAGARSPHSPDGFNKLKTMREGDKGWTHAVLTEGFRTAPGRFDTGLSSIGVRTPRYSYINYASGIDELYDLRRDPYENQNRVQDPAYSRVVWQLKTLTWQLHDCVGLECHVRLAPEFARTPEQTRALTEHYWAAIKQRYGWGAAAARPAG